MEMGKVICFPRHERASSTKKSGRIFSREMPVSLSTWKTRLKGTPRSPHRVTVALFTEQSRAKSTYRRPFSAKRVESCVLMFEGDSCTTNNSRQAGKLHKSLTTAAAGIDNLATMQKPRSKPKPDVTTIYDRRQPKRPHYLAEIMEWKDVDRAALIEDLGVDKSLVSRWLDEDDPSTPGKKWAQKLGRYFAPSGDEDDFVDIFTDPALARFRRLTLGKSKEEVDRILNILEMASPVKRAG